LKLITFFFLSSRETLVALENNNGHCNRTLVSASRQFPAINSQSIYRSLALKPHQKETVVPQGDLRITNVSFGDKLEDTSSRTAIKMTYDGVIEPESDEEEGDAGGEDDDKSHLTSTFLCALTPGKVSGWIIRTK
jgi:Nucleoplasmin-like domain